jgi:hypothetical protein
MAFLLVKVLFDAILDWAIVEKQLIFSVVKRIYSMIAVHGI